MSFSLPFILCVLFHYGFLQNLEWVLVRFCFLASCSFHQMLQMLWCEITKQSQCSAFHVSFYSKVYLCSLLCCVSLHLCLSLSHTLSLLFSLVRDLSVLLLLSKNQSSPLLIVSVVHLAFVEFVSVFFSHRNVAMNVLFPAFYLIFSFPLWFLTKS